MKIPATDRLADYADNDLVADSICRLALGNVSPMTWWRWQHDPSLNFPEGYDIRRRKFRRAGDVRRFRKEVFGF